MGIGTVGGISVISGIISGISGSGGGNIVRYLEYIGAIHIHSIYSDGSGTMSEIIEAGQSTDLDFIVVTDHDTLEAKTSGWEGWHDHLLVLVGEEVAHRSQHCLALGLEEEISKRPIRRNPFSHRAAEHTEKTIRRSRGALRSLGLCGKDSGRVGGLRDADPEPTRRMLERIKEQHGLSFLVHPHGRYRPFFFVRSHEWKDWDSDLFDGIEIWSYMFDWVKDFRFYKFRRFYRDPEAQITGPFPETLRMWDRLCRTRRVVGIAGLDVHAKKRKSPFGSLVVFPYEKLFRTIRTHILSEEAFCGQWADDARIVYRALKRGHCFGAYDLLWPSHGFRFTLQSGGGSAVMGDEMKFSEDAEIRVVLPRRASLRILRNGEEIRSAEGDSLRFSADAPGGYRVEVSLGDKPWIYSNPIYLRG